MERQMSRADVERCNRALDAAAARYQAWAQSPEGRAALDAGWEKQKADMRKRGLTPGPD
jgi:hypothetical protein